MHWSTIRPQLQQKSAQTSGRPRIWFGLHWYWLMSKRAHDKRLSFLIKYLNQRSQRSHQEVSDKYRSLLGSPNSKLSDPPCWLGEHPWRDLWPLSHRLHFWQLRTTSQHSLCPTIKSDIGQIFLLERKKICSFQERQSWVFEAWLPFATGDIYWGWSGSNCTSVIHDHITQFQKCYYGLVL